jgi:tetraacyldisaccharide 4'-kinase
VTNERRFIQIISGADRSWSTWLLRPLLRVASWPYAIAILARNWAFDHGFLRVERSELPIISVGNITAGGTGKTPLVIWLAQQFRQRGIRVAILSRGYRAIEGSVENDEAREVALRLPDVPQLINSNRVDSARIAAEELEMQLCLLDDGFQHRRLGRTYDLVLIDAVAPFGHGYCFPRGLLREPLRGLQRATLFVITRVEAVGSEQIEKIKTILARWNDRAPIALCATQPNAWTRADGRRAALNQLAGTKVAMLCGIGNPDAFRATLVRLDVEIVAELVYLDHHHYTADDLLDIERQGTAKGATAVVCTSKDLVKIERNRLGAIPLWALEISMEIQEGREYFDRLLEQILE